MNTKTDRGWYSVETWLVALWIDNEQSTSEYWRAVAEESLKLTDEGSSRFAAAKDTLANRLQEEICDATPPENKGVFADLLSHALMQVEWSEIADHLLNESVLEEVTAQDRWAGPRPGVDAEPRFALGHIVLTKGALGKIDADEVAAALARHYRGDWGECCSDDWEANDSAIVENLRLVSVYRTSANTEFWIITEHDRSLTTILLPSEY